jgi:predicted amidohydrolase
VLDALRDLVAASTGLGTAEVVGAPLRADGLLFNCVVVCEGTLRGVVPKSYLLNYREFYEKRYFAAARDTAARQIRLLGQDVAFGPDLLFDAEGLEDFRFHVEICEDLWVPVPPSTWAALAGATVLVNLSASNIVIGKAAYRRQLCQSQSARCIAAYLYAASGSGESTTDLAWDGDALVCENGERLAEGTRFAASAELVTADIDLQRLTQDRMRMTSFTDARHDHAGRLAGLRRIPVTLAEPGQAARLRRDIPRFPHVPADPADRDERCAEVYHIQVHGLVQRLRAIGTSKVVIGISGGLDSAHALTIAAESMDRLGLPRRNILAYTMPGFATSQATLDHARQLMTALGATPGEIDIRPSARQMLRDIGHPAAEDKVVEAGESFCDVLRGNAIGQVDGGLQAEAGLEKVTEYAAGQFPAVTCRLCGSGLGQVDQAVALAGRSNVPDHGEGEQTCGRRHRAQADLDRECRPVLAQADEARPGPHRPGRRCLSVSSAVTAVCCPQAGRDEGFHCAADQFARLIAEHIVHRPVDQGERARVIG